MDLTAFCVAVMPLLYLTNAVPHRGIPVGIPRITNDASFWNRPRDVAMSGDLVSNSVPEKGISINGKNVPFTLDKNNVISGSDGTVSNLRSKTDNWSKNIAVKSSIAQGSSSSHSLPVRQYKPIARRTKTVTKKMSGRPRMSRMINPSLLITDNMNTLQQPKCHMPWINELSKIQYYWDGINALCDIAMTFEPCSTTGSVCRRYPVQFTCCPSTSLAVLKKCYKSNPLPENVCLPTKIQMSGAFKRPRSRSRPVAPRRHFNLVTPVNIPASKTAVEGCTSDCSPAWIDLFSNIKRVQNETLPVCQFLDIFKPCSTSGLQCNSHPVSSNCCPIKCVPTLDKCFIENPPDFVCLPRTIQPWISRLRRYFTG